MKTIWTTWQSKVLLAPEAFFYSNYKTMVIHSGLKIWMSLLSKVPTNARSSPRRLEISILEIKQTWQSVLSIQLSQALILQIWCLTMEKTNHLATLSQQWLFLNRPPWKKMIKNRLWKLWDHKNQFRKHNKIWKSLKNLAILTCLWIR